MCTEKFHQAQLRPPTLFSLAIVVDTSRYWVVTRYAKPFHSILNIKHWPSSWSHFVAIVVFVVSWLLLVTLDLFIHVKLLCTLCHLMRLSLHHSQGKQITGGTLVTKSSHSGTNDAVDREATVNKPQATLVLFFTSSQQSDTLSNAINNCVQLISILLWPLDASNETIEASVTIELTISSFALHGKLQHPIKTTLPFF